MSRKDISDYGIQNPDSNFYGIDTLKSNCQIVEADQSEAKAAGKLQPWT
jgi:hypothetical protein